jgi:hypothetical protein
MRRILVTFRGPSGRHGGCDALSPMKYDASGIPSDCRGVGAATSISFVPENGPVELGALRAGSTLVIRTRNNEYVFVLTDPSLRLGLLSGGPSQGEPQEAVLACAVSGDADSTRADAQLRIGSRAVFYLFDEGRTMTLTTSTISELRSV